MLEVRDLHAGYGETQVIHGVNLSLAPGRLHAILGRNGAGKTTTLKTIMGLVQASEGEVRFQGENLVGRPAYEIARLGIAFVPETRDIFGALTVSENLELAARIGLTRKGDWTRVIGPSTGFWISSPTWPNAWAMAATSSPVANNRCSRSDGRC